MGNRRGWLDGTPRSFRGWTQWGLPGSPSCMLHSRAGPSASRGPFSFLPRGHQCRFWGGQGLRTWELSHRALASARFSLGHQPMGNHSWLLWECDYSQQVLGEDGVRPGPTWMPRVSKARQGGKEIPGESPSRVQALSSRLKELVSTLA